MSKSNNIKSKNKDNHFLSWANQELNTNTKATREIHGDQSRVYRLKTKNNLYFLKIAPNLQKEHAKLLWLHAKLPVPKVIAYQKFNNQDALLLSTIKGKNLKTLSKEWPPQKIVNKLAFAINSFHSVDIKNCPFGKVQKDVTLVHGDATLSNIIFNNDQLSGFVDVSDARLEKPEIDYAAAVWSLEYNLGPGYSKQLLKKLNIKNPTQKMIDRMKKNYEKMQGKWGLSVN